MTHAERLVWLAERKDDCPDAGPSHELAVNCARGCKGSGKVPCFPTLRQKCSCDGGKVAGHSEYAYRQGKTGYYVRDCTLCQGRGWLPVNNLEATIAACLSFGIHNIDMDFEDDIVYIILTPEGKDSEEIQSDFEWKGQGAAPWGKPNEAATLALYKAAGGEA